MADITIVYLYTLESNPSDVKLRNPLSLAYSLSLSDTATSSDSISNAVTSVRNDSATPSDATVVSVSIVNSDVSVTSDTEAKTLGKKFDVGDSKVILTDSTSLSPSIIESDTSTTSDSILRTYYKVFDEGIRATDSIVSFGYGLDLGNDDSQTGIDLVKADDNGGSEQGDSVEITVTTVIEDETPIIDVVTETEDHVAHIPDYVYPEDEVVLTFNNVKSDETSIEDSISKQVTKGESDSVNLSDDVVINFIKGISDNSTLSDSIRKEIAITLSDLITLSDVFINRINLSTFDTATPTDSIILNKGFELIIDDVVSCTDDLETTQGGGGVIINKRKSNGGFLFIVEERPEIQASVSINAEIIKDDEEVLLILKSILECHSEII